MTDQPPTTEQLASDGSVGSVHTDARDGLTRDLWQENE